MLNCTCFLNSQRKCLSSDAQSGHGGIGVFDDHEKRKADVAVFDNYSSCGSVCVEGETGTRGGKDFFTGEL